VLNSASVLITGASGFIGRALIPELDRTGVAIRTAVRTNIQTNDCASTALSVGNIDSRTDWSAALKNIEVVVHLAARAHVMADAAIDPLAAYRQVNVEGTASLVRQAVRAKVKRIVFLSSIKVNGESRDAPGFNEDDKPVPEDAYGISKLEAEGQVVEICANTATEFVILRPPLVYGPGVKGNLAALMRAVDRGIPLPLGAVDNRRSLIGLDNLIGAIRLCIDHPEAAGKTFLVCDEAPVSSADLVRMIAHALGRKPRLLPVPEALLRMGAKLCGRGAAIDRLVGSLVVDSGAIRRTLGWQPTTSFAAGIEAMVRAYRET
jgi:UDP-glucose 4-epimerase